MGLISRLKAVFSRKKGKEVVLGLALGSGGAKGMAHLGALKAFEEQGISFQIVTGTSIGSIVGALYANGYSSSDMVGVVESINRREFTRNIRPFADMEFAEKIIGSYLEGDISDLKLPFAAWATNADTNEGVLLSEGNVAKALTASSAMPPFFRAIEIGGMRLYDGAFTNAIPADVCKSMGADLVIGCDLSAFLRPDEEKSRLTRLFGSAISAITPVKTLADAKTRGYAAADIMLRPNLYDFRPTDVMPDAMNEMFEIGYEEATAHMTEIEEAIANARKRK